MKDETKAGRVREQGEKETGRDEEIHGGRERGRQREGTKVSCGEGTI